MGLVRRWVVWQWLGVLFAVACGDASHDSPRETFDLTAMGNDLAVAANDLATVPSSDFAGVDAAIACPTDAPIHRGPCTTGLACDYAGPCGAACVCEDVYLRGAAQPGEWVCSYRGGPTCTSSLCPAERPNSPSGAAHPSCDTATWASSTCRYEDVGSGCVSTCGCDPSSDTWTCNVDCACPSVAPSELDACADDWRFQTCAYSDRSCFCRREVDPGPFAWDCYTAECPSQAPSDGASCDRAADRNFCFYSTPPYCGSCACTVAGTWDCTPSSCDKCPAAPAIDKTRCEGLFGQSCSWLVPSPGIGLGHTTYCSCSSGTSFSEEWSCYDV